MNTRAERIEEYKATIDAEIERLRDMRETEQDAERWLKLDADIDALLIKKDNAAVEIDAALDEIVMRELGTRHVVLGGEVLELDGVRIPKSLIDAQMRRDEEDMPF